MYEKIKQKFYFLNKNILAKYIKDYDSSIIENANNKIRYEIEGDVNDWDIEKSVREMPIIKFFNCLLPIALMYFTDVPGACVRGKLDDTFTKLVDLSDLDLPRHPDTYEIAHRMVGTNIFLINEDNVLFPVLLPGIWDIFENETELLNYMKEYE
jgi:hypothetical protein